jgi:hypothetical protein
LEAIVQMKYLRRRTLAATATLILSFIVIFPSAAANRIAGRVEAGGEAIAGARVSLWEATPDAPRRLAQVQTSDDGVFELTAGETGAAGVLYLIAQGGVARAGSDTQSNPATVLMATLGTELPERVTINELTTVASAWTATQFLNGSALRGNDTGLRIAAGNVPNLVDLETGGLGPVIVDPLNASRTTTLAKFNTLGLLLSACVTALSDACDRLFAAATPPGGSPPADTLQAAQNIARHPAHNADELFALLDAFYPVPAGKR